MFRMLPVAALMGLLMAGSASATVVSGKILEQRGKGEFKILKTDEPFSVGADNFDDDNLYAFDEDQNIYLEKPVRVDIGGLNGLIPAQTVVASHYVFFDSLNGVHVGYVDFDAPILGVAAYEDTMEATDFLANTGVNYVSIDLRGLERGDRVWIDPEDQNRLWVYWAGSSPGDYIRVFTKKSPGAFS